MNETVIDVDNLMDVLAEPHDCHIGTATLEYGCLKAVIKNRTSTEWKGWHWIYPCGCVGPCTWTKMGVCEYELQELKRP
jgi:hypothetical protein